MKPSPAAWRLARKLFPGVAAYASATKEAQDEILRIAAIIDKEIAPLLECALWASLHDTDANSTLTDFTPEES